MLYKNILRVYLGILLYNDNNELPRYYRYIKTFSQNLGLSIAKKTRFLVVTPCVNFINILRAFFADVNTAL